MTMMKTIKKSLKATLVGTVCVLAIAGAAVAETRTFDVPAGSLKAGLESYIKQSGTQLIYRSDDVKGRTTKGVHGALSPEDALNQLLGAGFTVTRDAGGAVIISKVRQVQSPSEGPVAESEPTEVIVTGTHIRGGSPTSPVHTITRKDIDQSGYSNVGDVLRSLPENFSGGQNPGVIGADASGLGNHNQTGASTVNLRGLGTDATLLLVNGHRMSADGISQASDISGVPMAAIQRIEVVPDGASALYGSDAVAGVVNVILKKTYSGMEVNLTGGAASQGGGTNRQASILSGFHTSGWFGMANIEYQSLDGVEAKDRKRTSDVTPETTLVPGIRRRSLFASVGHDLSDAMTISADVLISERLMTQVVQITPSSPVQENSSQSPAFTVAVNFDAILPRDWKLHVLDLMSGSRSSLRTFYPAFDFNSDFSYRNTTDSLEATLDGTLFTLSSGPVKIAAGAGTRHETFSYPAAESRQVNYAFGEVQLPLIKPSASRVGLHELEMDASLRTEEYSTFGSATDPKIGLRYLPFKGLNIRASWGKSFKAPTFIQMYSPTQAYVINASDLGYGASGTVVTTLGGNAKLRPEKSTSWTIGADYSPPTLPGFSITATYFNIRYTDRVTIPVAALLGSLSSGKLATFVTPSPSLSEIADVVDNADEFANLSSSSYDPTDVVAIFRNNYVNATSQSEEGFDFGLRQSYTARLGTLSVFANATVLTLQQKLIPTAPVAELSGTIFYVPKTKARAGLTFERKGFTATFVGNYVSSSTDNGIVPAKPIGSWTTADLTLSYALRGIDGKGLRIAISSSNVFDRQPPRTYSPALVYGGLNYDSTNASILGRFTSLSITKAW